MSILKKSSVIMRLKLCRNGPHLRSIMRRLMSSRLSLRGERMCTIVCAVGLYRKEAKREKDERLDGWFGLPRQQLTPQMKNELRVGQGYSHLVKYLTKFIMIGFKVFTVTHL